MSANLTQTTPLEPNLKSACEGQAPAELHFKDASGNLCVERARLVAVSDRHVLVDAPTYATDGAGIPPGGSVDVHVNHGGKRFQFSSAIDRATLATTSAADRAGPWIALRRPTDLSPSQRRRHTRISMNGSPPVAVALSRPHDGRAARSLVSPKLLGSMVDISAGGVCVELDGTELGECAVGTGFELAFSLPFMEPEFRLAATVRHCRAGGANRTIRVAFAFRFDRASREQGQQQRLALLLEDYERKRIRRRRDN